MVLTVKFTREDYEKLPEGYPVELIDGQLIKEPSPTYGHQWISGKLLVALHGLVGPSRVVTSPVDVVVDEHNVLQPDLLVLDEPLGPQSMHVGLPALVIEILSPGTILRDRVVKRRIYLDAGVREVWIVDPRKENVEIHTSQGRRTCSLDEPVQTSVIPEFRLTPRAFLRE